MSKLAFRLRGGFIWPTPIEGRRKAFFFMGDRYVRYDVASERVDDNYPRHIAERWGGVDWPGGIDAALLWDADQVYFFKGSEYVKYSVAADAVDKSGPVQYPQQIKRFWRGVPNDLDAAVRWPDGRVFFFKGSKYYRYDTSLEAVADGYPMAISDQWDKLEGDLDAVILWDAGTAYFFKDAHYVKYDVIGDRIASDERETWKHWHELVPCAVWAEGGDTPTVTCRDARLRGETGGLLYPDGTTDGQAGWDVGLQYKDLEDLGVKLSRKPINLPSHWCGNWSDDCDPIAPGQVTRLAIMAHGQPGQFFANGNRGVPLAAATIATCRPGLLEIGQALSPNAVVLLTGCEAAQGPDGSALLSALSQIWPGRRIVGFHTIGYVSGGVMSRPGEKCTEPGMRDSPYPFPSSDPKVEQQRYDWNDLQKLPWSSPVSPHAKIALNGLIVRNADQ